MRLPIVTGAPGRFQQWLRPLQQAGAEILLIPVESRALDQALTPRRPDVALLDLVDGAEALDLFQKMMQRIHPGARAGVVAVAAQADVPRLLAGEADDVVSAGAPAEEVLQRLRRVRLRFQGLQAEIRLGAMVVQPASRQLFLNGEPVPLRTREFDLLLYLASRPDRVFRREELAEQIWTELPEGSFRTVDTHICRIRSRLGVYGETHIQTLRGIGYRLSHRGVVCECCRA